MKTAIILHGMPDPGMQEYYNPALPSASNSHWLPWLQKQLFIKDIYAQTPEIPNSWKPDYPTWQKEFERYDITPDTILVGHSCGGGFIVRWLTEHPTVHVGKVVLVAPSLGKGWTDCQEFFDYTIDPNVAARTKGLVIFESDNDMETARDAYKEYKAILKDVRYREFHNYGHFCFEDMHTVEFPELLEELV
ncbi:MAG TPA: alpha/beta hydrolase [Candidatus Saccharimonadales bacterium]|nr:alpha/beta hydrolase [Candidatus Saccharimonadales bacterium]